MRREEGTGRKNLRRANNDSFSFKGEGDVIRDKAKVNKKKKKENAQSVCRAHALLCEPRRDEKTRGRRGSNELIRTQ